MAEMLERVPAFKRALALDAFWLVNQAQSIADDLRNNGLADWAETYDALAAGVQAAINEFGA